MRFGMGVPKNSAEPRREPRIPMEVGVHISGHSALPGVEATFTENVSSRGLFFSRAVAARALVPGIGTNYAVLNQRRGRAASAQS